MDINVISQQSYREMKKMLIKQKRVTMKIMKIKKEKQEQVIGKKK
jgi:hypothetical protein